MEQDFGNDGPAQEKLAYTMPLLTKFGTVQELAQLSPPGTGYDGGAAGANNQYNS